MAQGLDYGEGLREAQREGLIVMTGRGIFAEEADKLIAKTIADAIKPDGPVIEPAGDSHHARGPAGSAGSSTTGGEIEEHKLKHRLSGVGFGFGTALRNIILNVLVWGAIIAAIIYAQSHGVDIIGWFRELFANIKEWISSL